MLVRNIVFAFVGVGAFEYLTGPWQGLEIRRGARSTGRG